MRTRHDGQSVLHVLVWVALGAIAGCSHVHTSDGSGGETHFLRACMDECPGDLACVCGVCTRACDSDLACGELAGGAGCVQPGSSGPSCELAVAAAQVCDQACVGAADCAALGDGFACVAGSCRPAEFAGARLVPDTLPTIDTDSEAAGMSTAELALAGAAEGAPIELLRGSFLPWHGPDAPPMPTPMPTPMPEVSANGCSSSDPSWVWDEATPLFPGLPAPPATSELPAACDEGSAIEAAIAACGEEQRIDVAGSLAAALSACQSDRFCHVVLPAGDFDFMGDVELGCLMLEGAGADRTRITLTGDGIDTLEHVILARFEATAGYTVLYNVSGPLLVNEVDLMGGYHALDAAWSGSGGVAVCRSRLRSGYAGVAHHGAPGLVVAGSSIGGCFAGIVFRESKYALVVSNYIFGAAAAISIGRDSYDVTIRDNELVSPGAGESWSGAAVLIEDGTTDVEIIGNTVIDGPLPAANPQKSIVVEDNIIL